MNLSFEAKGSSPRALGLLALFLGLGGWSCEGPIRARSFEVVDLRTIYSNGDESCSQCIEQQCSDLLQECYDTRDCVDLSRCQVEEGTPAARASCLDEFDADREAKFAADRLFECTGLCFSECDFGGNFECADDYPDPRPAQSVITLRHQLSVLDADAPFSGAKVRFCAIKSDCTKPLAEGRTDENGAYAIEVEASRDNVGVHGFRGYRLIEHESVGSVRFELNIPIWGHRHEQTLLLPKTYIDILLDLYEPEKRSALIVQVLDCNSYGSGGIVFEIETMEGERVGTVVYGDGDKTPDFSLSATVVEAEGSALVLDLETDQMYQIAARRESDGQIVATGVTDLPTGQTVYFVMYPNPT